MFRRNGRRTDLDLERRLAAERPEAPRELVRRLSARFEPEQPARPSTTLRAALVCGVTASIVLSLGVAGAIGSATGSINGFSRRVLDLVQPPAPSTGALAATPDYRQILSDPRFWSTRQVGSGPPFAQQHAALIPVCWKGQITWVTPFEYLSHFTRGASPARDCSVGR
jgi:hypothetical protein